MKNIKALTTVMSLLASATTATGEELKPFCVSEDNTRESYYFNPVTPEIKRDFQIPEDMPITLDGKPMAATFNFNVTGGVLEFSGSRVDYDGGARITALEHCGLI